MQKLYVLSDVPTIKPITKKSYININLRRSDAHNCIYSFTSREIVQHIKQANKDNFYVAEVSIDDLNTYCRLTKDQFRIVNRCFCRVDDKQFVCEILNLRSHEQPLLI